MKGIKMVIKKYILLILAAIIIFAPSMAGANAYCSLRDPISAIQYLFPEATNHKSIVKIVGKNARGALSDALPFNMHFNELGKHTLYVAQVGYKPTGFIHARTELTDGGLVEIAWAMDLDLSVKNFYIQRCRLAECKDENLSFLRSLLKNKTFEEVLAIYNSENTNFNQELANKSEKLRSLSLSMIQSALKTIVITDFVWKKDIENISSVAFAKKY